MLRERASFVVARAGSSRASRRLGAVLEGSLEGCRTPTDAGARSQVWDSKLSVGDRVAVVGGGVVGCLAAYVASRVPGVEVLVVDVDETRSAAAAAVGAAFKAVDDLDAASDGDRDVVIHCSGNVDGCATALQLAGDEATVVEASWFGDAVARLPLGAAFHARRLKLVSSQVGHLPVERLPRWTFDRRLDVALKMAADPALDALFEPKNVAFEDLADALPELLNKGGLCHRILYPVPETPPTPPRPNDLGQRRVGRMKIALNTQAE